uniref:Uncharacterized protein n=1 Tax=Nelumbo nucifera TaxID=4432 RepID=A0A822XN72_NELNU|nr:TPA_asm: hypothetical protein HUJ06_021869 [Nelumbo nucifera]
MTELKYHSTKPINQLPTINHLIQGIHQTNSLYIETIVGQNAYLLECLTE